MEFALRPYQISALKAVHNDLKTDQFVLLQMVTGAGKTVIGCRLINGYYFSTHFRFLILAHKQELVQQFEKTFNAMTDISFLDVGVNCEGLKRRELGKRVTISTIQSFVGDSSAYAGCDLLIIDEVHRAKFGNDSQYDKVLKYLLSLNPEMRVVGFTATPFRLDHGYIYGHKCAEPTENIFEKVNHKVTYKDLSSQGYLMPLAGKVAKNDHLTADLAAVGRSYGDYNLEHVGTVMANHRHLKTAVQAITEHCEEYNHICVACCTIDHAEQLKNLLGDDCTTIHSKLTQIERAINMARWKSGEVRIMTSIEILIEGFDWPPLDCLVGACPTLSARKYLQFLGRVLRCSPGKEKAFFLDLTDNTSYFGLDLDNVKVEIPKKVAGELSKYEKECPNCGETIHPARIECPECGYVWPQAEITEAESLPELKDVEFGKKEKTTYEVFEMEFELHKKPNKIPSMKVTYYVDIFGYERFSEWICFEHTGYPREKAADWWLKMTNEPGREILNMTPRTVEEALSRQKEVIKPVQIVIEPDGKYTKIIDRIIEEIPF